MNGIKGLDEWLTREYWGCREGYGEAKEEVEPVYNEDDYIEEYYFNEYDD